MCFKYKNLHYGKKGTMNLKQNYMLFVWRKSCMEMMLTCYLIKKIMMHLSLFIHHPIITHIQKLCQLCGGKDIMRVNFP